MKRFIKSGFISLICLLINTGGCISHSQREITASDAVSASVTDTILDKTDDTSSLTLDTHNITTNSTVDIEEYMKDQRTYLENEKALRENASIAAKVNDVFIYQWEIESKLNENNAYLESYRMNLETMNLSEQQKNRFLEAYRTAYSSNKKDILNDLIRDTVIQIEIGKRGLFPTDEEVISKAKEQFVNIKKTPQIYASVQLYMEVMELSEDECLHMIMNEYKQSVGRENLYQQITAEVENATEKDEAFTAAVDQWLSLTDIKILIDQE